jgi:uncharacterized protein (TIGR02145 family)
VNDSKRLCPSGWHVPNDAEWTNLINFLDPNSAGGDTIPNIAGGKMKSTGTIENGDGLWYTPNVQATNESGFTGFPGGYIDITLDDPFNAVGGNGYWWSSSELDFNSAFYRFLTILNSSVFRDYSFKQVGFSVRCVRD